MTRMGTAVYQRNPRNPWLKEVKKSPWRLGGSKLFPRLRVRSAASRGTGPAANPRFGGSPIIPWRLGGSKSSSRLRVRSAVTRGTGPAANPRFGGSPIIPWRP